VAQTGSGEKILAANTDVNGLYVSTNNGDVWTFVPNPEQVLGDDVRVTGVFVSPDGDRAMFTTSVDSLFRSTGDFMTWTYYGNVGQVENLVMTNDKVMIIRDEFPYFLVQCLL